WNPSRTVGNKSSIKGAMYPPAGITIEVIRLKDDPSSGASSNVAHAADADGFATAKPECRVADFSTYVWSAVSVDAARTLVSETVMTWFDKDKTENPCGTALPSLGVADI